MVLLHERPSADAAASVEPLQSTTHQLDVIDCRLGLLEADRERLLTAAGACRRAAHHLPDGDDRERLLIRVAALTYQLDPFHDLRGLRQDNEAA